MPNFSPLRRALAAVATAVAATGAMAQTQTLTMWSHWPEELSKRGFVEERVKAFEASNPQCKVNLQFIQKADIYTQVKQQVRTGQAPDIFWLEPDEITMAMAGFLEPLDNHVKVDNLEDWARRAWTFAGKVYGLPVEAYSVELMYNKDLLKKVGVSLPANGQLSQAQFADLVKKSVAAGITPFANGVGDRPFPGAYFLQEQLLRKLGQDDYRALLTGKLSFKDPRVVEVMTFVKGLVDAGAYPKNFATLKLGESHTYFHTSPGAMMFPIATWYSGRAFVPPEKGGQPKGFPLGVMQYPAPDGAKCPECKTLAAGGSFVIYSRSKAKDCAGKLLGSMATPENGAKWVQAVALQTGIKTDMSSIQSVHAEYFRELQSRSAGAKFFVGTPLHYMKGRCAETFSRVLNKEFPGGQLSVDDAVGQMDAACSSSAS